MPSSGKRKRCRKRKRCGAGLRALQGRKALDALIRRVQATMAATDFRGGRPPLVVKIAPDLTETDMDDIAAVLLARKVDGLVVSNTTTARPHPIQYLPHAQEAGGLSGQPLFEPSTEVRCLLLWAQTQQQVSKPSAVFSKKWVHAHALEKQRLCSGACRRRSDRPCLRVLSNVARSLESETTTALQKRSLTVF